MGWVILPLFAHIKKLIKEHSPIVLSIIEPFIDRSNILSCCQCLGFDEACCNDNGKFRSFEKRSAKFSVISQTDQLMHTKLGGFGDTKIHLTFVYAKCSYFLCRLLWQDLITFSPNFSGAWMVGGDFNMVKSIDECFGSIPPSLPSREFGGRDFGLYP